VYREEVLPGAVLARVAKSHIRIGTFQYFAARDDGEALSALCAHVINRHFPEAGKADNQALALLQAAMAAQARLIASWQLLGFIHGVMNTDNALLSGETIDYGPCAFMDGYEPGKVFSSIDQGGRYAYSNQPQIAHWNLACLGSALLTQLSSDQEQAVELAQQAINEFPAMYDSEFQRGMCRKLGIVGNQPADAVLSADLFDIMEQSEADFTQTFHQLNKIANGDDHLLGETFSAWLERWQARRQANPKNSDSLGLMQSANPVYIPRNHLVEAAIEAAVTAEDYGPFHSLVDVLADPWHEREGQEEFAAPPKKDQLVQQTFCGT
jgi:uncharacterized protein YdiU (UPF0061 family)